MFRVFVCSLILFTLLGCARSGGSASSSRIAPLQQHSGAIVVDDVSYLLWLEQRTLRPVSMQVQVLDDDGQRFEGAYIWRDGLLRELKQRGRREFNDEMRPFSLHVRYDTEGAPVFQRFRIGGQILPMKELELLRLYQEVEDGVAVVKRQAVDGFRLYQGVWKQGVLVSCSGNPFEVEFQPGEQMIPKEGEGIALLAKQRRLSGTNVLRNTQVIALLSDDVNCFKPTITLE
ncbi:DUF1481 domain-containing protein [Thaumasiovibrio subtropicus]|uniref:DUF1481 domain-containing protein n=1 Tax=Thaumasiovibrio subtropicus TaxID=1891207 RepID=UPI000B34C69F|nr:DUF1481 domain-containing protein [Thaumasiovibrio subtropicus]